MVEDKRRGPAPRVLVAEAPPPGQRGLGEVHAAVLDRDEVAHADEVLDVVGRVGHGADEDAEELVELGCELAVVLDEVADHAHDVGALGE